MHKTKLLYLWFTCYICTQINHYIEITQYIEKYTNKSLLWNKYESIIESKKEWDRESEKTGFLFYAFNL